MSHEKIYTYENAQERFSITEPNVITNFLLLQFTSDHITVLLLP